MASLKDMEGSSCGTVVLSSSVFSPFVDPRVVPQFSVLEGPVDSSKVGSASVLGLILCRSCVALDRLCWRTDGAVGKKSAKPADDRDMIEDGYKPEIIRSWPANTILNCRLPINQYHPIAGDLKLETRINTRIKGKNVFGWWVEIKDDTV